MKDENEILKDIIKYYDKIIDNTDETAIAAYIYLKNNKDSQGDRKLFELIYTNFYRLTRGTNSEWRENYFKLLYTGERDIGKILEGLKKFDKKEKTNFSFATKMAHTNDFDQPIWDKFVGKAISSYTRSEPQYKKMQERFTILLKKPEMKDLIKRWKKAVKVKDAENIPDMKVLDFILWTLGKIKER